MIKSIVSVALSVVLSTALTLGFVHLAPSARESILIQEYAQLRETTWRMDMTYGVGDNKTITVGFCSAVAIKPDVLLTAAHCDIASDSNFQFFGPPDATFSVGGKEYKIIKKDEEKDLMLIEVKGLNSHTTNFKHIVPGNDHPIVVIGYPIGLVEYVTSGRVQNEATLPEQLLPAGHKWPKYLAVDASASGGNSGGGLFIKVDGEYYLIGICSMAGGRNVTLFVHPDVVAEFLK